MKMEFKGVNASKPAVLFPDELDIIEVVAEKFQADNWFRYMSDKLKEKHQP